MSNKFLNKIVLGCLILSIASINVSKAQVIDSIKKHNLLVRDSLDFANKHLSINTNSNEFSPILYKGGLLYISNQPIKEAKVAFNKIYWTEDPSFKIIDKEQVQVNSGTSVSKYIKIGKGDDFTAPTSNDNNILVNYKKSKKSWNTVERNFINFSTDQAFAYNDSTHLLIYAKKANRKINGIRHWELWQAYLLDGRLKRKKRIDFDDKNANYLYPFITNDLSKLYFSSDKKGSKGGYDIYFVNLKDNNWESNPSQLDSNINTIADELAPFVANDSLFFSSNRVGGIGGFDIYSTTFSNSLVVTNQGYPLNSVGDEISLKKMANNYFLTTNRAGNFDIVSMQYLPVIYPIFGVLTYKNDGSLVSNHTLLLRDVVAAKILDTIKTDDLARYHFSGKPNRNYEFVTLNGDSVLEVIDYATVPNQKNFEYAFSIHGRSPKQKADSLQAILAMAAQKRADSIAAYSLATKFIVHYGFNKSTIAPKEKLVLDSLLIKLQKLPNTYIVVGAFTDCIGSYKYNHNLSLKRGKAVVNYLIQHGLNKNRFVSNGYASKYNVTPCTTGYAKNKKQLQQNNRRAEIVLNDNKKTDWATLEKQRGKDFYTSYNTNSVIKPTTPALVKLVVPITAKKDTASNAIVSNITKVPAVVNADFKSSHSGPSVSNHFTKITPSEKQKDTITVKQIVAKTPVVVVKKDSTILAKVSTSTKKVKDSVKVAAPKVIIAKASEIMPNEDLSKEDIIKALDSLAKLKKEQERIVEYLTKRINKKPIDVFVSSDSVTVELYDNGIHDKDSVSVIYNNRIVVDRQELKVNKPIKFVLKVDKNKKNNELVMVAENLGIEPPNTAVMFITEKSGRRQQIMLSTDMTHNEVVYFIRIGKE